MLEAAHDECKTEIIYRDLCMARRFLVRLSLHGVGPLREPCLFDPQLL
jgi:hypothetical protein